MSIRDRIWLPESAKAEPREARFVCAVPTGDGPCGERFYSPEELGRHVKRCASEHVETIHAMQEAQLRPLGGGDTEREEWTQEHREEILEGRMTDSYGKRWRR